MTLFLPFAQSVWLLAIDILTRYFLYISCQIAKTVSTTEQINTALLSTGTIQEAHDLVTVVRVDNSIMYQGLGPGDDGQKSCA